MRHGELERCRPWIEAALEYSGGTHAFEDVSDAVQAGVMQLWPAPRGCLVTEIQVHPRKKVLNVFLAGGELDQLMDMWPSVESFAKANECAAMTCYGRAGWERVLKAIGARRLFVVLGKELT